MSHTVAERLVSVHPKSVAAHLHGEANPDRNPLAEQDWRERIGRTIERALLLAELTKQELSYAMGYADQSALSRWIAGVERPLFDKLFAVDRFYDSWVIALAERNPRLEVVTEIRVRRVAA